MILIKGILHQTYVQDEAEYGQLVVLLKFRPEVLKMLHYDQGYQETERPLSLLCKHFH